MVFLSFGSRLYGRQDALTTLQQVYQSLRDGDDANNVYLQRHRRHPLLVLLSGDAGSGKTALARTLQTSVQQDGGFFGSGKFNAIPAEDITGGGSPSMATEARPLIIALGEWIQQLLHHPAAAAASERNHDLTSMAERIRNSISKNFHKESLELLRRVIPEFEMLLPPSSLLSLECATSDNVKRDHPCKTNNPSLLLSCHHPTTLARNTALTMTPDSRNTIKIILSKFIVVLAQAITHVPMVLFLDDLQWSDQTTLDILHDVLLRRTADDDNDPTSPTKLLLMGAFRHDQVSTDHALSRMLQSLQEHNNHGIVTMIPITPLTVQDIEEMIVDVLKCSDETQSRIVAHSIHRQTKGNALFVQQVVNSLMLRNHHNHTHHNNNDESDEAKIMACCHDDSNQDSREMNDNDRLPQLQLQSNESTFLDTTICQMKQHNASIRYQLKVAACLGNQFPMDVWQAAVAVAKTDSSDASVANIDNSHPTTNALVSMGYLEQRDENENGSMVLLQWKHDLVWQAAYSLIPQQERPAWHVSIGRTLLRSLPSTRIDDTMFLILSQWSHSVALLTVESQEKMQVAQICLRAGEKAAMASSFQTASNCLGLGIRLMEDDEGWKKDYQLSLKLRNAAIDSSFCIVDFEQMDQHLGSVLRHAKMFNDSLHARTMQIYALGSRGRHAEAYQQAVDALEFLGLRIPTSQCFIQMDYLRNWHALQRTKDRTLLNLPLMKDANSLAAMSILFVFTTICTSYRPQLLRWVATRSVRLTLKYGLCPASSQAFLSYGMSRLVFGKRKEAFRVGQLALNIIQTLNANEFLPRSYLIMYAYIYPWNRPLRDSLGPLEFAFRAGLETGDVDTAARCRFQACKILLTLGRSLSEVQAATRKSHDFVKLHKQQSSLQLHKLWLQFVDNLSVRTNDPLILSGAVIVNQDRAYQVARESNNQYMLSDLPILRLLLAVYFNHYDLALEMAAESRIAIQRSNIASFAICLHRFYEGVAAMAAFHGSTNQTKLIAVARRNLKELQQFEQDAPENCRNKVLLLEAELLAAQKGIHMDVAMAKFDRSIAVASAEGFVHEQALACERAGMALRRCHDFTKARHYLLKASELYMQWGADAKVRQMTEQYRLEESSRPPLE